MSTPYFVALATEISFIVVYHDVEVKSLSYKEKSMEWLLTLTYYRLMVINKFSILKLRRLL